MELKKKSETEKEITFTYDKPAGNVEGYLYYADGKRVSRTFKPSDLEVTFGKVASGKYAVEAVGFNVIDKAEWPVVDPEPQPSSARLVAEAVYEGYSDVSDVPLWRTHGEQAKADDRMRIVDDPLGKRGKVMRVEVRSGDSAVAGSNAGERADVMASANSVPMREGTVFAAKLSIMLPTEFRSNNSGWNVFIGAHDASGGTQSPLQFEIRNDDEMRLRILGGVKQPGGLGTYRDDLGPWTLAKNVWHDVVWGMKFSADPAKGYAVVYLDGNKIVDQKCANLYQGSYNYHKQGWYRVAQSYTTVLYFDSTRFWTANTLDEAVAAARR